VDLWPAIDIRGGRCVRLLQGDYAAETVFGDPLSVARSYVSAGAERLHIVDLDAARTGDPVNRDLIGTVVGAVGVPVQVGGGVRDEAAAEALFGLGVSRVVLGTAAIEEPQLLKLLSDRWPRGVVAGLDYRWLSSGTQDLAVRGWTEASGRLLPEVLSSLSDLPLAGVVVTDISRDGTGRGPDIAGLRCVLAESGLAVISSGGVASLDDLRLLASLSEGSRRLGGAIVGKALLAGEFSIAEAAGACAGRGQ
jgi:phosphoribosylformimino-5-aminoimidazole carboxamide ribotide isomerase